MASCSDSITRAALITPAGPAGIALVRIVGPEAKSTVENIFRPHNSFRKQPPNSDASSLLSHHQLLLGVINDDNKEIIDQVIVAYDRNTNSVEINCHGGPRIVQRLLLLLQKHHIQVVPWPRLHEPTTIAGEVSQILPHTQTRMAAIAIAAQHPTGLHIWTLNTIETLRKNDQIIPAVREDIEKLILTFDLGQKLLNPATVVLAGPVNAGKSTLANALTGRTQSITSDLPGTTRDWTIQLTDIEGIPINLIDTAGGRDIFVPPSDSVCHSDETNHLERRSIARAGEQIARADLVVLVFAPDDMKHERFSDFLSLLPADTEPLILVNKSDLADSHPAPEYLHVSALTNRNLDDLRRAIADRLGFADFNPLAPLLFTPRQHTLLRAAATAHSNKQLLHHLKSLTSSPTH